MKLRNQLKLATCVALFGLISSSNCVLADESCARPKRAEYKLYGSKSNYKDVLEYLSKGARDEVPKSLQTDSFEREDKRLREQDSCEPVSFYFIGRHSARFPKGDQIEEFNKKLQNLLEHIKTKSKCPSIRESLLKWRSKMVPRQSFLITEVGGNDERDISRRFKRIYPEFFDTTKSNVQIGVTDEIRTAQTGAQFFQEVNNLNVEGCDISSLPTNDVNQASYDVEKVLKSSCYNDMLQSKQKSFLNFYKECKQINGQHKIEDKVTKRLKSPKLYVPIIERLAQRLGMQQDKQLITMDVVDSIYSMCRFETAIEDESVWCSLIDKRDVEIMEYIEDYTTYYRDTYGPLANVKKSCPLIRDLVQTLQADARQASSLRAAIKRNSYLYFTHAEDIKPLFGAFGLFRDDENFSEAKLQAFENKLEIPKNRDWRATYASCFSANLAFVLYRCAKKHQPISFKVLTSVTEQPVKLAGCEGTACASETFFTQYQNFTKDCDLNKICAKADFAN